MLMKFYIGWLSSVKFTIKIIHTSRDNYISLQVVTTTFIVSHLVMLEVNFRILLG